VSKSPLTAFRTLGALTAPILYVKEDAESLLNTAQSISSIPFKLPSLSSNGTKQTILKEAIGATELRELFVGVIYGSAGVTKTLLGIGDGGGKLKTEYFVLSTSAFAIVVLRVVIATGIATQSCYADQETALASRVLLQAKYFQADKEMAENRRL